MHSNPPPHPKEGKREEGVLEEGCINPYILLIRVDTPSR
jgi:hypothetical protein